MEKKTIQFIVYLPLQQKKTDRDKNAPSNRDDEGGGYPDKVRTHENESFFIHIAQKKGLVNTGPFYKTIKLC
jgi:hypothetical protein